MKEAKEVAQDPVQEIVKEIKKTPESKMVGQIRPDKGHSLFKYNKISGKLTKEEIPKSQARVVINAGGKSMIKKETKVQAEEGCIYLTALNLANAVKKLAKYHGLDVQLNKK